jgi:type I restriction enzyme R subunit
VRTRRERAEKLRADNPDLFTRYGQDARAVLDALLDKYAANGLDELALPDALKVAPVSAFGNPSEIARRFGGPDRLRVAIAELTELLYAA